MTSQLEKLRKAFEILGTWKPDVPDLIPLSITRRKDVSVSVEEKKQACRTLIECMTSQEVINMQVGPESKTYLNFLRMTVNTLASLCNERDSYLQATANETFNLLVKYFRDASVTRFLLVTLVKALGEDDERPARAMRALLTRTADLAVVIKPHKAANFAAELFPTLKTLSQRGEELQADLAVAVEKLCPVLIRSAKEAQVKELLKAFLFNLHADAELVQTRRTAALCVSAICRRARNHAATLLWLLEVLLDMVIPVDKEQPVQSVFGVLLCLRYLAPQMAELPTAVHPHVLTRERLIQLLELLLFHAISSERMVAMQALEALRQVLALPHPMLANLLLQRGALLRSSIFKADVRDELLARRLSQSSSFAASGTPSISQLDDCEENALLDENQLETTAESQAELHVDNEILTSNLSSSTEDPFSVSDASPSVEELEDQVLLPGESHIILESDEAVLELISSAEDSEDVQDAPNLLDLLAEERRAAGCIGTFYDADTSPGQFVARQLCWRYLLSGYAGGTLSERTSKEMAKMESLACLTELVQLEPQLLCMPLLRSTSDRQASDTEVQFMTDVFLLTRHEDARVAGKAVALLCAFVAAAFRQALNSSYREWLTSVADEAGLDADSLPSLDTLVQHLLLTLQLKGEGERNATLLAKETLTSLPDVLNVLLKAGESTCAMLLLSRLPLLVDSSYWLVPLEVLRLLSTLDLRLVAFAEINANSDECPEALMRAAPSFQEWALNMVENLLEHSDHRVVHAAANCLAQLVGSLHLPQVQDAGCSELLLTLARSSSNSLIQTAGGLPQWPTGLIPPPLIHALAPPLALNPGGGVTAFGCVEHACAMIINRVVAKAAAACQPRQLSGCVRALTQLACAYPPSQFACAWCLTPRGVGGGLLSLVVQLLNGSSLVLDTAFHTDLLNLTGKLLCGAAFNCWNTESCKNGAQEQEWGVLENRELVPFFNDVFLHVMKMLCIFHYVIDESNPVISSKSKVNYSSSLSPKRIQKAANVKEGVTDSSSSTKKKEVPLEKDQKKIMGNFTTSVQYMRMFDSLKASFATWKSGPWTPSSHQAVATYSVTAELGTSFVDVNSTNSNEHRLTNLLQAVLHLASNILEIASYVEVASCVDELLSYVRSAVRLDACGATMLVVQLLKAIFGFNMAAHADTQLLMALRRGTCGSPLSRQAAVSPTSTMPSRALGLTHIFLTSPLSQLASSLRCFLSATESATSSSGDPGCSLYSWLQRWSESRRPILIDRNPIVARDHIAKFQHLVVNFMKMFIHTWDVELQTQILSLFCLLMKLGTNYSRLDHNGSFLESVLRQLDQLDAGVYAIGAAEPLVPHIFNLLILLTSERLHNAPDNAFQLSKVIQLADSLRAAEGIDVSPALRAVTADLFLGRSSRPNVELDAQREFVVSLLLRKIAAPAVQELLLIVLTHSRRERDSEERWKRLSRQVADHVIALLSRGGVLVDSRAALETLNRLLSGCSAAAFRPLDPLLKFLFTAPNEAVVSVTRWASGCLAVLRVLFAHAAEETILARLQELNLLLVLNKKTYQHERISLGTCSSPTCSLDESIVVAAIAPDVQFASFFFQTIGVLANVLLDGERQSPRTQFEPRAADHLMFLRRLLSSMLLYFNHVLSASSGFHEVAGAARILAVAHGASLAYSLEDLNCVLYEIRGVSPQLTLQWCSVLVDLGYAKEKFWSRVLRTPKPHGTANRTASAAVITGSMESLLSVGSLDGGGGGRASTAPALELLRQSAFALYAKLVVEQSSTACDLEKLTWMIVNHVRDLIALFNDPAVHDLVSAIHRNAAASNLFIQALTSRCEELHDPLLLRNALRCLEPLHLSSSGALLQLLVAKFLGASHCLAVSRRAGIAACRRVEMLLAQKLEDSATQLPLVELDRLLIQLEQQRHLHDRLITLLRKYRATLCCVSEVTPTESAEVLSLTTAQAWLIDITLQMCSTAATTQVTPQLCARLLRPLNDALQLRRILGAPSTRLTILEPCIRLGSRALIRQMEVSSSSSVLFVTSEEILLERLAHYVRKLPRDKDFCLVFGDVPVSDSQVIIHEDYRQVLQYLANEEDVWTLCCTLRTYLALRQEENLPVAPRAEAVPTMCRFVLLLCEILLEKMHSAMARVHPGRLQDALRLIVVAMQHRNLVDYFSTCTHWLPVFVTFLFKVWYAGVDRTPGLPMMTTGSATSEYSELQLAKWRLAVMLADLVHSGSAAQQRIESLRLVLIGLARLPAFNKVARKPLAPTQQPDLDDERLFEMDLLKERAVLQDFVRRTALLGWTSRQQFEMTWVSLINVLNPTVGFEEELTASESMVYAVEQTHCRVLSVRGITRLLMSTLTESEPGNPLICKYEHLPRSSLKHMKSGVQQSNSQATDVWNLEREEDPLELHMEQLSLEALWANSFDLATDVKSGFSQTDGFVFPGRPPPLRRSKSHLDTHSCIQFIKDLFQSWLRSPGSTSSALMAEMLRCLVLVSDLFMDAHLFEWLATELKRLQQDLPVEDDVIQAYLLVGLCKTTALGARCAGEDASQTAERLLRLLDSALTRPDASVLMQASALHGVLYLLQANFKPLTEDIDSRTCDYLDRALLVLAGPLAGPERLQLLQLAAAFYYAETQRGRLEMERWSTLVSSLVSASVRLAGMPHPPPALFVALYRGWERLLHYPGLPQAAINTLANRLAIERLRHAQGPRASLPPLCLLVTIMHQSSSASSAFLTAEDVGQPRHSDDVATDHVALERLNAVFARLSAPCLDPVEARLLTRLLPPLLLEFMPAQSALNKATNTFFQATSGSAASKAAAELVQRLFRVLLAGSQQHRDLVPDWVMLSLANLAQRVPIALAHWSLAVFFIAATSNRWLRGSFPLLLARPGFVDEDLFGRAATDFFASLDTPKQFVFVSTLRGLTDQQGHENLTAASALHKLLARLV